MQNQVLAVFPGLPRQIVKSFMNNIYQELSRAWQWSAFEKDFNFFTFAPYTTGTVSVSVGSRALVGSGTTFLPTHAGKRVEITGSDQVYEIESYTDATHLTLLTAYSASAAASGATFKLFQNLYPISSPVVGYSIRQIFSMRGENTIKEVAPDVLDGIDPERTTYDEPVMFVKRGQQSSGVHLVELYPIPNAVYNVIVRCRINPSTLSADSDIPLMDSDLIVKGSLVRLVHVYARMGHPEVLGEYAAYKQSYQEALYECQRDDFRHHSQRETIKDVVLGGDTSYPGDNFAMTHDMDFYEE
jgi:hypothetical protein